MSLQHINTDLISPHPDNPRKDLGDLTELAESIKINGILQNLTIVASPDPSEVYRVIIGHRRLAAAKLAGMTEVPCIVVSMTPGEQVATMLMENIQRDDLTVYEQAQGFQMLLNFDYSVTDIVEKTGFSETTVRRRVKLLELDGEKFKAGVERGATLFDFAELNKIKDVSLRNEVLSTIGTKDFKWRLDGAIRKETSIGNKEIIISELQKFASEVKNVNYNEIGYMEGYYTANSPKKIKIPDDAGDVQYFYKIDSPNDPTWIYLYKKRTLQDTVPDSANYREQNKVWEVRHKELEEISNRAYRLRYKFVQTISNAQAKKNIGFITKHAIRNILDGCAIDLDELTAFLNIEISDDYDEESEFNKIASYVIKEPERYLLITLYLIMDTSQHNYYSWNNEYQENEDLDAVYDFLKALGYEMSEEEKKLQFGTHELFNREGEGNE